MINIGEAFGFYAKYCAEMDMLFGDEDFGMLAGMSDENDLELRIKTIGNQASIEAAKFLQKVTDIFFRVFEVVCRRCSIETIQYDAQELGYGNSAMARTKKS